MSCSFHTLYFSIYRIEVAKVIYFSTLHNKSQLARVGRVKWQVQYYEINFEEFFLGVKS